MVKNSSLKIINKQSRKVLKSMILSVSVSLIFTSLGLAAESVTLDHEDELKFSIASLKESAAKVRLENKKLRESIKNIPSQIRSLEKDLEDLNKDKAALLEKISHSQSDKKSEERELNFAKTGIERLKNEYKSLSEQEGQITKELHRKEQEIDRIKSQIEEIRKHIASLENKFSLSDNRDQIVFLEQEKRNLEQLIDESEYTLKDLEKELADVRQKNTKPLEVLKELEKEQDILKQKIAIIGDEYEIAVAEGQKMEKEIQQAQEKNTAELQQLNQEISDLKNKKEELEAVLTSAEKKLAGKKIDVVLFEEEEAQMKKSLESIRREKETLKTEVLFLEGQIKEFQNR